jgi:AbrB family looped-hinge helix DNA binding protein
MKTFINYENVESMMVKMAIVVKRLRISKGFQVTVPAETREKYGLKTGDELVWVDTGREVFIRPLRKTIKLTDIVGKYDTDEEFDSVSEHNEIVSGAH